MNRGNKYETKLEGKIFALAIVLLIVIHTLINL